MKKPGSIVFPVFIRDFLVHQNDLKDDRIELLNSDYFRQKIETIGGYKIKDSGMVIPVGD